MRADATEAIRTAIVSGDLNEGTRVNESRLALDLGISRGPIREALRALEREGRLVSRPNHGTYVATFTLSDVIESIDVRELIEPFAIQRSLGLAREELISSLRGALAEMRRAAKAGNRKALALRHDDFHAEFYLHARHRLILGIWERLRLPLQSHMYLQQVGYRTPREIPEAHERLLHLIERGDGAALNREIRGHLRSNVARFTEAMAPSETKEPPRLRQRKVVRRA